MLGFSLVVACGAKQFCILRILFLFLRSRDLNNHKNNICLRNILNLLAPQATTKENPNIVLNYVYKKAAIFKKEVPSRDGVREA